jgi:hypothetical protein
MARGSEDVVRATTLSTRSAWDANRRIVTTVRLRVLERLSGSLAIGSEFEVENFGGVVGETEMILVGWPHFTPGAESVLFLQRQTNGSLGVMGLAQGKFDVLREGSTETLHRTDLDGVQWVRGTPGAVTTLQDLRTRVANALRVGR